jgi:hypothetical protein
MMGSSYHTARRVNVEHFHIDSHLGTPQQITLRLDGYSAPTEEAAGDDHISLTVEVDTRQVRIEAPDLSRLLHPLIEALRLLLAAQTVNEDELDDMWTRP